MSGSLDLKGKWKMSLIIWANDKGVHKMQIIDQSERSAIALMQIYFWGALSLITLRKSEVFNLRLQEVRKEYREASSKNRV